VKPQILKAIKEGYSEIYSQKRLGAATEKHSSEEMLGLSVPGSIIVP
jgi:hypothetical protein